MRKTVNSQIQELEKYEIKIASKLLIPLNFFVEIVNKILKFILRSNYENTK